MNYYNDNDARAGAWIRELIRDGLIPEGHVDERSILDVTPSDLAGYTQCHFFAGIAGWPYALRLAGWPESEPCWTGSCPCQPFSAAGKAGGVGDERHLWPAFRDLIAECRPPVVFGEQVASKAGRLWLAGVRVDLERMGYAVGCADLPAASVGAPHIRQRLWWVAESERGRSDGAPVHLSERRSRQSVPVPTGASEGGGLADGERDGRRTNRREALHQVGQPRKDTALCEYVDWSRTVGAADLPAACVGAPHIRQRLWWVGERIVQGLEGHAGDGAGAFRYVRGVQKPDRPACPPGPSVRVDWTCTVWWPCRDGKWRRVPGRVAESGEHGPRGTAGELDVPAARHDRLEVEPALFPLADGIPGRVGLLRGAGNAIVPQVAAAFIEAFIETKGD